MDRLCMCTDFCKKRDLADILRGIVHLVARISEDDDGRDFLDYKLSGELCVPSAIGGNPGEPMLANFLDDLEGNI